VEIRRKKLQLKKKRIGKHFVWIAQELQRPIKKSRIIFKNVKSPVSHCFTKASLNMPLFCFFGSGKETLGPIFCKESDARHLSCIWQQQADILVSTFYTLSANFKEDIPG
jgi:hypothetical protein